MLSGPVTDPRERITALFGVGILSVTSAHSSEGARLAITGAASHRSEGKLPSSKLSTTRTSYASWSRGRTQMGITLLRSTAAAVT